METGETETVHLKWPTIDSEIGDIVEYEFCRTGKVTLPVKFRRSSESPYNLLCSTELAKELLQAVSEFERRLTELRQKSEQTEPAEEHKKLIAANGAVAWELGQSFLYPVYRRG